MCKKRKEKQGKRKKEKRKKKKYGGIRDSILSLHIKSTSNHIKVILCKIEKFLLILGTARGCEEQNYIFHKINSTQLHIT